METVATVSTVILDLRRRFFLAKGLRSVVELVPEIGVHRAILTKFLKGGNDLQLSTLRLIEAWVEQEEQAAEELRHAE